MLRAVCRPARRPVSFPLLCPGRRGRRHRHALSGGRAQAAGEHHGDHRRRHRAQRGAHAARAAVRAGRLHDEGPVRQQRRRDQRSTCAASAPPATQNTLILIDGRRQNDFDLSGVQWASIPLPMIERIEILRGTGAVLYGDNASAGVVNIVTRSPLKQGRQFELMGRRRQLRDGGGPALRQLRHRALRHQRAAVWLRVGRLPREQPQRAAERRGQHALGDRRRARSTCASARTTRSCGCRAAASCGPPSAWTSTPTDPRGTSTPLDYASRDGARAGGTYSQRFGDAEFSIGARLPRQGPALLLRPERLPVLPRGRAQVRHGQPAPARAVLDRRRGPQPGPRRRLEPNGTTNRAAPTCRRTCSSPPTA